MEADLSHFLLGVSALGNVQLVEALALQCLADGGLTDGSEKDWVQIDFLHIHLLEAELSHFFIGVSALGNAEHVEVLALQCLADGGLTAGNDKRFLLTSIFLTSIFGGRSWPLSYRCGNTWNCSTRRGACPALPCRWCPNRRQRFHDFRSN